MHNLGLGGLEFNPTHTIYEHRPVGFQLPNVIEDVEYAVAQHATTDNASAASAAEVIATTNMPYTPSSQAGGKHGSMRPDAVDAATGGHKDEQPFDVVSTGEVENDDSQFRLMHDPKHRHPRHHGLFANASRDHYVLFSIIVFFSILKNTDMQRPKRVCRPKH